MAKKKPAAQSHDVRQKAAALREAQRKSELRTRNIIIGVVSVLAVAIVAAIVLIILNRPTAESAAKGLPEQFQGGAPISVSAEGIGAGSLEASENDLAFYFDYTCPGCVVTDSLVGPLLFEAAEAGDFNFVLHPVVTSGGAFNIAGTAAILQVAADDPEHFTALHEALINFSYDAMSAEETSVLANLDRSKVAVRKLAAEVGVPQDIIDKFDTDAAQSYLNTSSENWVAEKIEGREKVASPEFVYRGVKIVPSGTDGPSILESITSQMAEIESR